MKNWFFNQALSKAARIAGHPGRVIKLIAQLAIKLYQTDFKSLHTGQLVGKVNILGRMAGAYGRGEYRAIPWKTLITVVAALLYFVNPVDLIPDLVPAIGLTDDFTVLLWVYSSAEKEISKFLAWESGLMVSTTADHQIS